MKKNLFSLILIFGLLLSSCAPQQQGKDATAVKPDASLFEGQWTLDIAGGWVGWLEVNSKNDSLSGSLLWKWGSVEPVETMFVTSSGHLIATRGKLALNSINDQGKPVRNIIPVDWADAQVKDGKISGTFYTQKLSGNGLDTTTFTGTKLPPVGPAPDLSKVKFGSPETLFNGKDLTGWKLVDEKLKNGFTVSKGILVNDPVQKEGEPHVSYGNLRTVKEFGDFNLKLEVNVPAGSNSGIYLKGMYEIQVLDSYKKPLDSHNMGALYSRITPSTNAEKPAGEWQSVDITLCERHLTVILNGTKIIDNQPVYGPTGGAIKSDVFADGPLYLQGDHGKVSYRNIVLTPIVK